MGDSTSLSNMGKKTNASKKAADPAVPAKAPAKAKKPTSTPAPAATPAPVAESTTAAEAPKTAPAKKTEPATAPVKKPAAVKATPPPEVVRPSLDDIALRAYFISEARQRDGRAGDSTSDWVEAERQLLSELNAKPAAKSSKAKK